LGLGSVVSSITLDCIRGVGGVLSGKVLDLRCLGTDHLVGVFEVGINDFLVGDVDQWCKIEGRDANERQSPEWDNLDEPVGDQGAKEGLERLASVTKCNVLGFIYCNSVRNILSKENTLELNDEEVDELLDIFQRGF
jgi:hypothetical protein